MLIIDSGFGGLTVLDAIKERFNGLPQSCVYIADSLHAPYGEKPNDYVLSRVRAIVDTATLMFDIKIVVIACHTASSIIDQNSSFGSYIASKVRAVDTIQATAQSVLDIPMCANALLLCTESTKKNSVLANSIKNYRPDINLTVRSCKSFASLIERFGVHDERTINDVQAVMGEIMASAKTQYKVVIYGCTHYPLLHNFIKPFFDQNTIFIDPADSIAAKLDNAIHIVKNGNLICYTTGNADDTNIILRSFDGAWKSLEFVNFVECNF